jgi:hypothetical protein
VAMLIVKPWSSARNPHLAGPWERLAGCLRRPGALDLALVVGACQEVRPLSECGPVAFPRVQSVWAPAEG